MSRPLRLDHPGAIWHITSRGNERRDIFRDDRDRRRFIEFLAEVVEERRWVLHAWVLMSNHYHLLLETPEAGLSRGIQWLNQQYAETFNLRHGRVGHLFQGRFKGILVEREGHLLELLRYIVLNPVRCGAVASAGDYPWSNYRATAGIESAPPWLAIDWTLEQFDRDRERAREAYELFVADARSAAYRPWERLAGQVCLGERAFKKQVQRMIEEGARSREHSEAQLHVERPVFDAVVTRVCERYSLQVDELRMRSQREARKALCYLVTEDAGLTLRSFAEWLEVTEGAASLMRSAARKLMMVDGAFRTSIHEIRRALT